MVTFGSAQSEQPLLENRIVAVPQRKGEAQPAFSVADSKQSILAPPVRPAARVIVRQVVPTLSSGRIVLANGTPLAFGQVGSPSPPVTSTPRVLVNPNPFCVVAGHTDHAGK